MKALHVLNMLLIDGDIPKYDAHVVALRLAESEDQSAGKVAPHVVRLDVGEQDVRIDGKGDSQTVTFPSYSVDHAGEGGHAKGSKM